MGQDSTSIRDAARLQQSLGQLIRILHLRDRRLASSHGLSVSQCHALQGLMQVGPMTITELGDHLHLEKSTASRLAKGLVAKELVRTRAPSGDGRVSILQLTEAGQRLARRILNEISEEYRAGLEGVDPRVQRELPSYLDRLAHNLAGHSP